MQTFNIGDVAYLAYAGPTQIWKTCPECLGSARLLVTLGDGTQVSIPCVCCERGLESIGKLSTYEYAAAATAIIIQGVEVSQTRDGVETRYKFEGCRYADGTDVFPTREAAMEYANTLVAKREAEEKKRLSYRENKQHTWAWNVSYHRREIERAKKDIAYHTAKLNAAPKDKAELAQ